MNEYGSKAAEAFKAGRESVADTLDDAGSRLDETARVGDTASEAVRYMADKARSAARYVRDYDASEMAGSVKTFVTAHPIPTIIGAAVVGFLVGRAASARS